jgi:CheY-like chemotaxis protein
MHSTLIPNSRRILIVDDNPTIHEDFRKIFELATRNPRALDVTEAALFGTEEPRLPGVEFELSSAHQGRQALEMLRESLAEQRPYAMAFMDVRMPPGWDGIETTAKLWDEYPDLQVVLCTAYSDYSWVELVEKLGNSDRLLILKKPFDNIEVVQMAHALTMKWQLTQLARLQWKELETRIDERTQDLEQAYLQLQKQSDRPPAAAARVDASATDF